MGTDSALERNDLAIQKAKDLAASHSIKASAYKVDGRAVIFYP